jgi:hypothetical protein
MKAEDREAVVSKVGSTNSSEHMLSTFLLSIVLSTFVNFDSFCSFLSAGPSFFFLHLSNNSYICIFEVTSSSCIHPSLPYQPS